MLGKFWKKHGLAKVTAVALLLGIVLFGFATDTQAIKYGSGTYGACQYDTCSITITTSGTVNLNITPSVGGAKCTTRSDSVGVATDSSTGYTLTATDAATNSNLNGTLGGAINSTTGTAGSPIPLVANSWGYRVDGSGSFGAGPTGTGSSAANDSLTFAGMPNSGQTPVTLATSSSIANPAVTTSVWYRACVDTTTSADTYTTQVIYTAVIN